jgi:hypothetical protein
MAAMVVGAIDGDALHAHPPHLAEGDFGRAVGHPAMISPIAVGVKPLSIGRCLLALAIHWHVVVARKKNHSAAEPRILRAGSHCALNEHVADLPARAGNATTLPNPHVQQSHP